MNPASAAACCREHLSQEHDAASRRSVVIDRQVEWIHRDLLGGRPVRVLDLGCGPGLYTSRLARRGCRCTGIDFSPASVAYAAGQAQKEGLACRYVEGDVRSTPFETGFELAMFIFGELNVFRQEDARLILSKAYSALGSNGVLVLEPHTFEAVRGIGLSGSHWYSASSGLFSETHHIYLEENFWDEPTCTATTRYLLIDARDGSVTTYGSTMQAYSLDQYKALLEGIGFRDIEFQPSLEGHENPEMRQLLAITARK